MVLHKFDKVIGTWNTRRRTTRSEAKDLTKMFEELSQNKTNTHGPGRKHHTFRSMRCNKLYKSIDHKKLHIWMKKKRSEIIKLPHL